jgi:ABC-type transporter Mla subunit MlaD
MPTGGSFTVDLERAPQTLRDLTAARDELRDLVTEAQRLGKVDPSSADDVSRDAATLLGAVADGGDGSLVNALNAGVQRLDSLINAIKSELRSYSRTEEQGHRGFDATSA